MLRRLFITPDDWTYTIVRAFIGFTFFAHGAQSVLGAWGGQGFSGTMHSMTTSLHIPAFLVFLAIMAEFAGGIALLVGLFARIAALGIAVNMVVAIAMVHAPNGFFMNWMGNQKGEGFEYHLLAIALCIVTMIKGAGAASIDRLIAKPKAIVVERRAGLNRRAA